MTFRRKTQGMRTVAFALALCLVLASAFGVALQARHDHTHGPDDCHACLLLRHNPVLCGLWLCALIFAAGLLLLHRTMPRKDGAVARPTLISQKIRLNP